MAAITVTDITTALRDAGIDYTVEHPGTSSAEVIVGDLRLAPALDEDGHTWDGINSIDGQDRHDWHATIADAVERAAAHTGVEATA